MSSMFLSTMYSGLRLNSSCIEVGDASERASEVGKLLVAGGYVSCSLGIFFLLILIYVVGEAFILFDSKCLHPCMDDLPAGSTNSKSIGCSRSVPKTALQVLKVSLVEEEVESFGLFDRSTRHACLLWFARHSVARDRPLEAGLCDFPIGSWRG